jgi:hypothetical protein
MRKSPALAIIVLLTLASCTESGYQDRPYIISDSVSEEADPEVKETPL